MVWNKLSVRIWKRAREKGKTPSFTANVLYQFGGQSLSFILGIGVSIIVARWLGPEGKGIVSTLQTFLSFYFAVALLGLPSALTYYIASRKYPMERIISTFCSFVLLFLYPLTLLLLLFSPYLTTTFLKSIPLTLLIVSLSFSLLSTYLAPLGQSLIALRRFNYSFIIGSLALFLRLALLSLFLILFKWGVWGVFASDWCLIPLNTFLAFYFLSDVIRLRHFIPNLERTILKDMLRYGLAVFLGNILWMVNTRFDVFVVNSFWGAGAVGLYMTGVNYTELMRIVPTSITSVLFPQVSSLPPEESRKLTSFLTRVCPLYYIPTVLFLYLLAPIVIPFFFGSSFVPSISVVPYLIPGIISWIYLSLLAHHLSGRGYPNYNLYSALAGSLFTLLLDFLLIPRWGIRGASVASSVAYSMTFIVDLHFFRKLEKVRLGEIFLPRRGDFVRLLDKAKEIMGKREER